MTAPFPCRPPQRPDMNSLQGSMLIVDDVEANRELLRRRLVRQGHEITTAIHGREAIEMLRTNEVDLVLCDIMMPEMDGYEFLEYIKQDADLRHIPVIMISAVDDIESVVRCIEMGAEDYLPKPFNPTLLRARIGACLEKKQLRDQEQAYIQQIKEEQARSEQLLLGILPKSIADQLKQREENIGDCFIGNDFETATILFADLVNFTQLSSCRSAMQLIQLLNTIFSAFDKLAEYHGLEKIKTIGDAYMVVGGVPIVRADHAEAIAHMALDMLEAIEHFNQTQGENLSLRIGISTGPVVAGVIGTKKFSYDLWGDAVNTASRMESQGLPGRIQISESTRNLLVDRFYLQARGPINVKGKGQMNVYFLDGARSKRNHPRVECSTSPASPQFPTIVSPLAQQVPERIG
jgi:adenylate cyclase